MNLKNPLYVLKPRWHFTKAKNEMFDQFEVAGIDGSLESTPIIVRPVVLTNAKRDFLI